MPLDPYNELIQQGLGQVGGSFQDYFKQKAMEAKQQEADNKPLTPYEQGLANQLHSKLFPAKEMPMQGDYANPFGQAQGLSAPPLPGDQGPPMPTTHKEFGELMGVAQHFPHDSMSLQDRLALAQFNATARSNLQTQKDDTTRTEGDKNRQVRSDLGHERESGRMARDTRHADYLDKRLEFEAEMWRNKHLDALAAIRAKRDSGDKKGADDEVKQLNVHLNNLRTNMAKEMSALAIGGDKDQIAEVKSRYSDLIKEAQGNLKQAMNEARATKGKASFPEEVDDSQATDENGDPVIPGGTIPGKVITPSAPAPAQQQGAGGTVGLRMPDGRTKVVPRDVAEAYVRQAPNKYSIVPQSF